MWFERFGFLVILTVLLGGCASVEGELCSQDDVFAAIGSGGNVYLYDVCAEVLSQLTFDGVGYASEGFGQAGSYYFFDRAEVWSPDGERLIVGRDYMAYVIDLREGTVMAIGERVVRAFWSPDGGKVALVTVPEEQESLFYDPVDYNRILVVEGERYELLLSFDGNAPAWVGDDELVYFRVVGVYPGQYYRHSIQRVSVVGGQSEVLPAEVETWMPVRYARLSVDGAYAAVSVYAGFKNLAVVELGAGSVFRADWDIDNGGPPTEYTTNVYAWSPGGAVLAVCTSFIGVQAPLPIANSLIVVEPGEEPRVFDEPGCASQDVSWHSDGEMVVFRSFDGGLGLVDVFSGEGVLVESPVIDSGPWWSASGGYLGFVAEDGQVYVTADVKSKG